MSPDFLTLDDVLEIHRDQIERYGGSEGIRDLGLLESALAQPGATFSGQFLHTDLHEMAAAYLFHLVQNHPFLDGNKRVGAAAAAIVQRCWWTGWRRPCAVRPACTIMGSRTKA